MERTSDAKPALRDLPCCSGSCQKLNFDKEEKIQRVFSLPLLFLEELVGWKERERIPKG